MNIANRANAVYLVSFSNTTEYVRIVCIGIECIDTSITGNYTSITKAPDWMQRKVATLAMLSWPSESIDNLGERVDEHTYWVYDDNKSVGQ